MPHPLIEYMHGPITSLLQLLDSLTLRDRKTHAMLYVLPGGIYVREQYDDGKGHSNAITSKDRAVAEEVYRLADSQGLISGAKKPGYISTAEFVITDLGKHTYHQFKRVEREALGNLCRTKYMRACDLEILIRGTSKEAIAEALDESVRAGRADKEEVKGETFYYPKERATTVA